MKRFYLLILMLIFPLLGIAQGVYIKAMGIAKSTWLLNEHITNQGITQDYDSGWGLNFGLGATFWFSENMGVGGEVLYGRHTGDYIGKIGQTVYNSEVELKVLEVPVLFTIRSRNGFYAEAGPGFNWIQKAHYTAQNETEELASKDVSNLYPGKDVTAIFGFGFAKGLSDRIGIQAGFRFAYGMFDLKGVDALGRDLNDRTLYHDRQSTTQAYGGLQLGLLYIIE